MSDASGADAAPGSPRVFLHVGVPKTGTTFVQDVLWRGRSQLARAGVCYPLQRRSEHFAAAMDLRQASWAGRRNPRWDGTWERLVRTVREADVHTAVISSELLAAADSDTAARAVAAFPDHEVHVVLTIRDLARQLVSGWQEQVKHRVWRPLPDFVAGCLADPAASKAARHLADRFWELHDLPAVASRWGTGVPAERVHLVTVPPRGGPRALFWERFASVVGVDPGLGDVDTARANKALGAAEAEFLRRYNQTRVGDLTATHYDQVVRVLLAEEVLAKGGGPPLRLPSRFSVAVHELSRRTADRLGSAGYDVVGDLEDLVPDLSAPPVGSSDDRPSDDVGPRALAATAVHATAGMVTELGPLKRRLRARQQRAEPGQVAVREPARVDGGSRPAPAQPEPPVPAPGPVYLHIGAPKTGTTFLQDVMWHHRDQLADAGVRFSRRRYGDHYQASLDLRSTPERPAEARGRWDAVVADTLSWGGTSVISHELFAPARREHIEHALATLGRDRVHIVYTVRDLWRLLGAEWQEATKHGRSLTFEQYLVDVLEQGRKGDVGRWFWSVHDPLDVLGRWGAGLPPERVHVVTVPPAGTDPRLLWDRFAGLVGIDPGSVDTTVGRSNPSLGAEEVTFLRRVNERIGGRRDGALTGPDYSRYVKTLLAQDILAERPGKKQYEPPADRFDEVDAWAGRTVAGLRSAGYDVVGDLDELRPRRASTAGADPDAVTPDEIVEVGLDAVAGLVRKAARMREAHGFGRPEPEPTSPPERGPAPVRRVRGLLGRGGNAVARRLKKAPFT